MATLQDLRRGIQRQIIKLTSSANTDVLRKLAATLEELVKEEEVPGEDATELELFDFIMAVLNGDNLTSREDQGMAHLLFLNDLLEELQQPPDEAEPVPQTETVSGEDVSVAGLSDNVNVTSSQANQIDNVADLVKLRDVTRSLPRREFKIHCGQISDADSDVSYNTLCKQIDEGLAENFTETEVIRTVIKMIKPGTFKEMLLTKDGLTVAELKRFFRAHLRDKSSAELFQELCHARQTDKESPQQFMYRLMGLKQRVLFASQQSESEFHYDSKLVQGVFLHSLYQGLNEKFSHVRRDLKSHIVNMNIPEDSILEIMSQSISEEVERQTRLGHAVKTKTSTVNVMQHTTQPIPQQGAKQKAMQAPTETPSSVLQTQAEVQANRTAIHELTAQVSALTKSLEKALSPAATTPVPVNTIQPGSTQPPPAPKGRCKKCITDGIIRCTHCFKCGQDGHRAVGCLVKHSGNWTRSLGRGHQ